MVYCGEYRNRTDQPKMVQASCVYPAHSPEGSNMIISRQCNHCQKEYPADTRYLNRNQGQYCSISCSTKDRWTKVPPPKPNATCAWCNNDFYRVPSHLKSKSGLLFCCKDHQDFAYRAKMVITGPVSTKTKITTPRIKPEQLIELWLAGNNSITLSGGRVKETKPFVKKYLIDVRGDKCEQCFFSGINSNSGRSIIQLDHIDGNCLNNNLSNLRLLCPNCHAMTPTYGALNRGSGRSHRRKSQLAEQTGFEPVGALTPPV